MRKYFGIWMMILGLCSGLNAQIEKTWTLQDCINYALEQNITIRKTGLSIMSLEEQALQVRAQRLPSVNASVTQNFNWRRANTFDSLNHVIQYGNFTGENSTNYAVNTGVTLFNGSRLNYQIRQSDLSIDEGRYNLESTKESVSLSILNAFLQVLYAEEQVNNAEKQIESTTGQVNLAFERLNLKIISQADYFQVKSQLASEKLSLANAQSQLALSRVNLMQLMELPVKQDFNIQKPILDNLLNQNRTPEVQPVFDTALSIKPQIKSAAIEKEIASLDEKIARSGYLPSLSANAGIGTNASFSSANAQETYIDQMNHSLSPSAGISLSIPLFQKRQVKTSVALAKINALNAELSETETRNQLRKSVEQACQDVISAQTEYEASLENFQSMKESAALSDEKFRQGIINSVDYLVSKTNLIVSESQLLQSKYNLIFSYKILDFYSGVPLTL